MIKKSHHPRIFAFKLACLLTALAIGGATIFFSAAARVPTPVALSTPPAPTATPTPPCPPIKPGGAFADNNGLIPPNYKGERFMLSDNYPKTPPPKPVPTWNKALDGPFPTSTTVEPYMMALRDYAYKSLVPVDWRANKIRTKPSGAGGWYQEPWMGHAYETCQMGDRMAVPWPGRDYIRGTYFGTPLEAGTMPGQTCSYNNYEIVYYNDVAGHFIGKMWRGGVLRPSTYQFPEGTVITKLVFTTAPNTGVLANSPQWQVYVTPPCQSTTCVPSSTTSCPCNPQPCPAKPQLTTVTLIQMDIVLKDSKRAPQTGWMFSTYVYNPDFNPSGANNPYGGYDHMMPLGIMWGNDPQAIPSGTLKETVINGNPQMPSWFTNNLGWGGRLSGPIDGAKGTGACLSCHSSSEYTRNAKAPLETFQRMIPPPNTPDDKKGPWFRNLAGNQPWSGKIGGWKGLDYSFVMLGAITHYYASIGIKLPNNPLHDRKRPGVFGNAPQGLSSGGNNGNP